MEGHGKRNGLGNAPAGGGPTGPGQDGDSGRGVTGQHRGRACYRCGKMGHISRNCHPNTHATAQPTFHLEQLQHQFPPIAPPPAQSLGYQSQGRSNYHGAAPMLRAETAAPVYQSYGYLRQPGNPSGLPSGITQVQQQIQGLQNVIRGMSLSGVRVGPPEPFVPQLPLQYNPQSFQRMQHPMGVQGRPEGRLYEPSPYGRAPMTLVDQKKQNQYLDKAVDEVVKLTNITPGEHRAKVAFTDKLCAVVQEIYKVNGSFPRVKLETFGSFASGFAHAGSDVDLTIVSDNLSKAAQSYRFGLMEHDLPRALEKRLLQMGFGARLLTRTRVPILKVCEKPNDNLLDRLRQEREEWDLLPNEKKYPFLHREADSEEDEEVPAIVGDEQPGETAGEIESRRQKAESILKKQAAKALNTSNKVAGAIKSREDEKKPSVTRLHKRGPLDFPSDGVGVHCDINFFNPLGLHNTHLLRNYSMCDDRVRPMVLFVKEWAKRRKINSSYSGTLCSYGWVLMVLHYLINVAQPPVLPNLQAEWRLSSLAVLPRSQAITIDGNVVDFWRSETHIMAEREAGRLTGNRQSVGELLVGFFRYFSYPSPQPGGPKYRWVDNVISLRNTRQNGIMSKQEKGWTIAKTDAVHGKEVRHRYLFCIEDPFELQHNVARTVTSMGINWIRREFRRADRILIDFGKGQEPLDGGLLDIFVEECIEKKEKEEDNEDFQPKRPTDHATLAPAGPSMV